MQLRSFSHLHFIQAIKGGSVTKVLNVTRGRPTLKFKVVAELHDGFMFNQDGMKAERSCIDVLEERTVKTEPDSSVCNPNDDKDDLIINLDDDDFDNFTLTQIKQSCIPRKRKHSQGLESSSSKIDVEDALSLEDDTKTQTTADDSDFMETLSTWRSKLSKKAKKRKCNKDPITSSQEIIPVVKIEEIQNDQEFSPSSGVSAALVDVKAEVLEAVCLDEPCGYSCIEAKEETEIPDKWCLENELNSELKEHDDPIPQQIEWPYSTNYVTSNSDLNSDQSPNILAIEFGSEEGIIHQDPNLIPPPATSLVEDHDSVIYDNQPDGDTDTPVILSNMTTHKEHECVSLGSSDDSIDPDCVILGSRDDSTDLDCMILGSRDDSAFLGECSKVEFTAGAEVQAKPSSTAENGLGPGESQVCSSNESPEYEDKQSFASVYDDEKIHVSEASDELNSCDEHKESSKLHPPKRLLSARKAISPTSQEKLCNAIKSIDLNHKNNLKCSGKLNYGEQTDKKNGADEGLNNIMRPGFTDNPNRVNISPKTLKSASHPKGIFKSPQFSRSASRRGCNSVQSCSKSAIAFSKQQMHDVECLTMKLTKDLKAMKDIVDDMLRSEFCLNTSLRYKVNEARMAVKNATRAEEAAKRCLSYMARDCSRFCKIMKLADGGNPPTPQDATPRKERKKIAFADEAGGRLCQIRFYEDEEGSLSESK